jgi:hypothetical protein
LGEASKPMAALQLLKSNIDAVLHGQKTKAIAKKISGQPLFLSDYAYD